MTAAAGIQAIFAALGLPPEACVDARVPKKLLVEQGAPTPADKRAIQEGIPFGEALIDRRFVMSFSAISQIQVNGVGVNPALSSRTKITRGF